MHSFRNVKNNTENNDAALNFMILKDTVFTKVFEHVSHTQNCMTSFNFPSVFWKNPERELKKVIHDLRIVFA